MKILLWCLGVIAWCLGSCNFLWAQDGATLYRANCASCHEAGGESRAPGRESLRQMAPEQILAALERGIMSGQGAERTPEERRAIAEFLSGKLVGSAPIDAISRSAFCRTNNTFQNVLSGPSWNGWGVTQTNTRFQPAESAGISGGDVPRLKLKWAFGFPGDTSASAQPTVVGGRLYVGSYGGSVYSLEAKTGCIYWKFDAEAGVRTAITIAKGSDGNLAAYFGDGAANVYAVDAATGRLLWKVKVENYPTAKITGAPKLNEGRLYVPVSSGEEGAGAAPTYECCKFRGSLVALNASNGDVFWRTYTIQEEAHRTTKNRIGTQLWGPSGVSLWNSPTLDLKRKSIYLGTGNNYSNPPTNTSDAIVAFDLESGKIRWARQLTPDDAWNTSCPKRAKDQSNCPRDDSPDFDFASSPILVDLNNGRQLLIAGQKSGMVYAIDPDQAGRVVWQQRVGQGGTAGGVQWGPAADGENLYVATSDAGRIGNTTEWDPAVGGGISALDLTTGRKVWSTPSPGCGDRRPCTPAQSAAVTAIPGVVFSGSVDGHIRAYSSRDGKIIWDYDTIREYTTVNGVKAKGGSIDNGGVAVVDGMLFTNSGYGRAVPGNVLLGFSVE